MKGGNSYSFRGRHISLALVILVILTMLLWTWERNPIIAMTLRSAQEWYRLPSEFPVEAPIESVGTSTLEKGVEKSISPITENGTKLQLDTQGVEAVDSTPTESPETQYNQNVMPSSRSKVTPTPKKGVEKSTTPITENGTKLQFDTKDVAAVDSIPAESPETLYHQTVMSSSRSKGRFFLFCS
ncbi:hypothetical protein GLYMA_08G001100v4 [Glycine max]|uniref:Uncharacterized protein n=2 Tax=Glycine subgen. Soja TaxID=1462606 RepID=A0A0R0IEQ1_SOYBN|nr:hypothetical protein JHK85_020481 [Glycine max]KAH1048851.1 hypothetical protein GYH30_019776 [Glycine max]KHN16950.1 hypothetical protein glysoja_003047 [Glycine soja]KRH40942.1 hypothetical protein GLYMA_08G001100v4 [Glycine max]RZB94475.1 hypothetical protein D0Y65_019177 [Glycine soja]